MLIMCWKAFIFIPTLRRPFNFALTLFAGLRPCFLSLRTRSLTLMANGLIEALFQLVLSGLKTLQAKALIDLRVEGSSK